MKFFAAVVIILDIWSFALIAPRAMRGKTDFYSFYSAAQHMRDGQSAYDHLATDPYIHPAYEAALVIPLTYLRSDVAFIVMTTLNVAIIIAAWQLLRFPWEFLAFPAFWFVLESGTDSMIFLACLVAAWIALDRNKNMLAGLLLGLGAFRFQDLIPIVLLLLLWKERKIVKGFVVSVIPLAAISCLLESPSRYVDVLLAIMHQQPYYVQPVERMANIRGMLWALAPLLVSVLLPALVIIVLIAAFIVGKNVSTSERFAIAIVASCLVSYHCYLQDLVILSIPVAYQIKKRLRAVELTASVLIAITVTGLLNRGIYLMCFAVALQFIPFLLLKDQTQEGNAACLDYGDVSL